MRRVVVRIDSVVIHLDDGQPVQQGSLIALERRADIEPTTHQGEADVGQRTASRQVF